MFVLKKLHPVKNQLYMSMWCFYMLKDIKGFNDVHLNSQDLTRNKPENQSYYPLEWH